MLIWTSSEQEQGALRAHVQGDVSAVDDHVVVRSGDGEEEVEARADPDAAGGDVLVLGRGEKRPRAVRKSRYRVGTSLGKTQVVGQVVRSAARYTDGDPWVLADLADLRYPKGDVRLVPLRDRVYERWLSPRHTKERVVDTEAARNRYRTASEVTAGRPGTLNNSPIPPPTEPRSQASGRAGHHRLSPESLAFIELFVRLKGNMKEMERELAVAYSTVRHRLDDVVRELGPASAGQKGAARLPAAPPAPPVPSAAPATVEATTGDSAAAAAKKRDILNRLDRGEITSAEAVQLLGGE